MKTLIHVMLQNTVTLSFFSMSNMHTFTSGWRLQRILEGKSAKRIFLLTWRYGQRRTRNRLKIDAGDNLPRPQVARGLMVRYLAITITIYFYFIVSH